MTELVTIADVVDALTNPIQVRERYEVWENRNRKIRYWAHSLPSLLDQLHHLLFAGRQVGTRVPNRPIRFTKERFLHPGGPGSYRAQTGKHAFRVRGFTHDAVCASLHQTKRFRLVDGDTPDNR